MRDGAEERSLGASVSLATTVPGLEDQRLLSPPDGAPESRGPEGVPNLDAGEAGGVGGLGSLIWRVFAENRLALVGLGIIGFMILFCFVGPLVYHTNQGEVVVSQSNYLLHPSAAHLLGTGPNGHDQLGRLMSGGRTALEIGLLAAGIATGFGVVYGAVSGFFGGVLDAVLMRIVDTILSVPSLFLLIVIATILHTSFWLLVGIVSLGAWLAPARLVRGETLTLRTREYVQAVRAMGGRSHRMILRHIVPNAIGTIIVNATFQVADAILILAALGFLGFGIPAPQTTWGQMLSNGAAFLQAGEWWLFYPAGIAIILTVIGFNFVGDALRDSFEVRLQRR